VRALRLLALLPLVAACNSAPPDLRPWRPSDHDHTSEPGNNQVVGGPDAGVDPELAKHGLNEVAIVAWEQNCVRCHGRFGRGDGPQGAMVHASDLTSPRVQGATTDEQLLATIKNGRGLMPAFPLPDETLKMLVQLIRLLGQATAAAPGGDAAEPPGSSAPGSSVKAAKPAAPKPAAAPSAR
jgi:mono/diheme cytochrome c family protein